MYHEIIFLYTQLKFQYITLLAPPEHKSYTSKKFSSFWTTLFQLRYHKIWIEFNSLTLERYSLYINNIRKKLECKS